MTDIEMDLILAKAEIAALKKGNMFTVPEDYVKVVRCRDCANGEQVQMIDGTPAYYCDVFGEAFLFSGDEYCSSGKRRENNG